MAAAATAWAPLPAFIPGVKGRQARFHTNMQNVTATYYNLDLPMLFLGKSSWPE